MYSLGTTQIKFLIWHGSDNNLYITNDSICLTMKVRATELYYIRATFPPLRHSVVSDTSVYIG